MFSACPKDILLLLLDYLPSKYYFGDYYEVLTDIDIRYKSLIPIYKERQIDKLGRIWSYNINYCLKEAAAINNYVEIFIEAGANNWDAGLEGAFYNGNLDIVNFFIAKGAKDFENALCAAVLAGNTEIIKRFLNDYGFKTFYCTKNYNWRTLLFAAAKSDKNTSDKNKSDENEILQIVKATYEEFKRFDEDENLSIFYGHICTGNEELIKQSEEKISEYDQIDYNYCLYAAIYSGSKNLIERYMQKTDKFHSALQASIDLKDMKLIDYFFEKMDMSENFLDFFTEEAGKTGDLKIIEYVLEKGGKFYKALYKTISHGYFETSKSILEKYHDKLNTVFTPSYYSDDIVRVIDNCMNSAIESGSLKMIKLVENYTNKQTSNVNFLDTATNYNFAHLINYFLEKGCSKNHLNAALISCIYVNLDLIDFFIQKGANAFNTAMIHAVRNNDTQLVQFFIGKGANDWDAGLKAATYYIINIGLIDFFIQKGASNLTEVFKKAVKKGKQDVIEHFVNRYHFQKELVPLYKEQFKEKNRFKIWGGK